MESLITALCGFLDAWVEEHGADGWVVVTQPPELVRILESGDREAYHAYARAATMDAYNRPIAPYELEMKQEMRDFFTEAHRGAAMTICIVHDAESNTCTEWRIARKTDRSYEAEPSSWPR